LGNKREVRGGLDSGLFFGIRAFEPGNWLVWVRFLERREGMLREGDLIGIVGCSNGLRCEREGDVQKLIRVLQKMGLKVICSDFLYAKEGVFSATGKERGEALNEMFQNQQVKAVFDISGGDVANEVLSYVDFQTIKACPKPFWGYSDLSVILNSIYSQTNEMTFLYTIQNLIGGHSEMQKKWFHSSLFSGTDDLFSTSWEFLRGDSMRGIVIGGNIRCFLKLAGTALMPDFNGKILFLEAHGGNEGLIASLLAQLRCMGAFQKIKGILMGTFTQMEKQGCQPSAAELVLRSTAAENIPVAVTREIGHGSDSKCMIIGKMLNVTK